MGKKLCFLMILVGFSSAFSVGFESVARRTIDAKTNARFLYDRDIYSDDEIKQTALSFFPTQDFTFKKSSLVKGFSETDEFSNIESKLSKLNLLMSEYREFSTSSAIREVENKVADGEALRCKLFRSESDSPVLKAAITHQEKQNFLANPKSEDEINKLFANQSLWKITQYKKNPILKTTSLFIVNGGSEIEIRCKAYRFRIPPTSSIEEEPGVVAEPANEAPSLQAVIKYVSDSHFGVLSTKEIMETTILQPRGVKTISSPVKSRLEVRQEVDNESQR